MGERIIVVSDPTKSNDRNGPFISYKVTTNIHRGGNVTVESSVTRRYGEFEFLSKELSRMFPGAIVPALPEKQAMGRFSADFVEQRQRGLEKYLNRIVSHRELGNADIFNNFLRADETSFARLISEAKSTKAGKNRAMTWLEGTVNSISNSGKAEIEKSAADLKVEEIVAYITALEKQMQSVVRNAESLVKRTKEVSSAMLELGQSFSFLGAAEGDVLGNLLNSVGSVSDSVSVFGSSHADAQAISMQEPLDEYLRVIASVKMALQQRQEKKNQYVDALTDVEVKQAAYTKLSQSGKEDKANEAQAKLSASQTACDQARQEYEAVSERLLSEYELFKHQKALDMREIILSFVNQQIEFNQKAEQAWAALLVNLQATRIQPYDPSLPVPPSHATHSFSTPLVPPSSDDSIGV